LISSVVSHPPFINDQEFTSPPGRATSCSALLLSVVLKTFGYSKPLRVNVGSFLSLRWFLLLGSCWDEPLSWRHHLEVSCQACSFIPLLIY